VFDARKMAFVIEILSGSATSSPPREEKKQGPKTVCLGGCGFFGDESQEGYCSLCYKKKMCGGRTATTTTTSNPPAPSLLCTNKCGFFGAAQYDGMCSVCFTKTGGVMKKPAATPGAKQWRRKFRRALLKLRCVRAFASAPRIRQKNKTRCWQCNKKSVLPVSTANAASFSVGFTGTLRSMLASLTTRVAIRKLCGRTTNKSFQRNLIRLKIDHLFILTTPEASCGASLCSVTVLHSETICF